MFDYHQRSLPDPNGNRTHLNHLWESINHIDFESILLSYDTCFEFAAVTKGKVKILVPEEAQAIKSGQRRYKLPQPPAVQILLKQAYEIQNRLETTPGLTRDAIAKQLGISPSYLTRILNLVKLAPGIQDYIQSMPPSTKQGPIHENSLKTLARNPDPKAQMSQFERLLAIS